MLGNTRREILTSNYIAVTIVTAGCAVLSLLSGYLNALMSNLLNVQTSDLLNMIYGNGINDAEKLLWFFALLLLFSCTALIYGALEYKFGRIFKQIFFGGLGLLFVFSSLLSIPGVLPEIFRGFKFFFGYGEKYGILLSSLNLIAVSLIFGGASFLVARRQQQNA
jgi:hypothetical protein